MLFLIKLYFKATVVGVKNATKLKRRATNLRAWNRRVYRTTLSDLFISFCFLTTMAGK